MNSPNATLEVACTASIKEEFTELDPALNSDFQSPTGFASQHVKSEKDEAVLFEEYNSEGMSQTNSSSSPINFPPRIKLERKREDDYADQLFKSINNVTTKLPSGSSNIGMITESECNNHDSWDNSSNPCPDFPPLATDRQSVLNLFTRIKKEGNDEYDTEVDPLHTIIDIKNEVSLEPPDCLNDHETEARKHAETSAPCASFNCLETSPTNYGSSVIDHTRLRVANEEITNDTGGETSGNERVKKKFPLSRRGNGQGRKRTHTDEKPFSCSHCSARFTRKAYLSVHMRTHTGVKPFSCSQCSACFTQKTHLNVHMRAHTGEKPFICSHCSARFARKDDLTRHMRTHTNEKPLSCSECSACFAQKGHLNEHLQMHTGEKRLNCSFCSARFTYKSALHRHMRTHSGEKPFSCSQCSACFTQKTHLNVHMRAHTGEKPFICSHCFARFTQKSNLNRHILMHSF